MRKNLPPSPILATSAVALAGFFTMSSQPEHMGKEGPILSKTTTEHWKYGVHHIVETSLYESGRVGITGYTVETWYIDTYSEYLPMGVQDETKMLSSVEKSPDDVPKWVREEVKKKVQKPFGLKAEEVVNVKGQN